VQHGFFPVFRQSLKAAPETGVQRGMFVRPDMGGHLQHAFALWQKCILEKISKYRRCYLYYLQGQALACRLAHREYLRLEMLRGHVCKRPPRLPRAMRLCGQIL